MEGVERRFANHGDDSRRINRRQNPNLKQDSVTVYRITQFFGGSNWKGFNTKAQGSQEKAYRASMSFART
jgi:hypothetical protein